VVVEACFGDLHLVSCGFHLPAALFFPGGGEIPGDLGITSVEAGVIELHL